MSMILVTGVPGAGKTLSVVSELIKRKDYRDRPVFIVGIPDLNQELIPHFSIPEGETVETWPDWAPDGALIVIDECQNYFRPVKYSGTPPRFITEFEVHRHRGLDFILITQKPSLIVKNVRDLVAVHKHYSMTKLGVRRCIQFEGCGNPDSKSDVRNAMISVYHLDKSVFGAYKSAEIHTKLKVKRSKILIFAPIIVIAAIAFIIISGTRLYDWFLGGGVQVQQKQSNNAVSQSSSSAGLPSAVAATTSNLATPASSPMPSTTPVTYQQSSVPVDSGPEVSACVRNGAKCTCYSDQATVIRDVSAHQCHDYLKYGIYRHKPNQQLTVNQVQSVTQQPKPAAVSASQPVVASR